MSCDDLWRNFLSLRPKLVKLCQATADSHI